MRRTLCSALAFELKTSWGRRRPRKSQQQKLMRRLLQFAEPSVRRSLRRMKRALCSALVS